VHRDVALVDDGSTIPPSPVLIPLFGTACWARPDPKSNSETAILADWNNNPEAPLPTGDTLPDVGATDFDTDLTTIANAEFADASADFEGYLASSSGDLGSLGDLGNLLVVGDLGSFL
jgi:hypothetical protein